MQEVRKIFWKIIVDVKSQRTAGNTRKTACPANGKAQADCLAAGFLVLAEPNDSLLTVPSLNRSSPSNCCDLRAVFARIFFVVVRLTSASKDLATFARLLPFRLECCEAIIAFRI